MMFVDDIVLFGDGETDMTEYLETWRRALQDRGMRISHISRPTTQFMDLILDMTMAKEESRLGEELQRVHHFKYLGSSVDETGGMTTEITQSECSMEKLEEMQWSVV